MVAVGEDLVLVRQVRPAGIDQIDAGQPVLRRDLLRAEVFLHRHREIGAALYRGVVADDHHLLPLDPADPGDQPGGGACAVIHALCGEETDLQKGRAGVQKPVDPFAGEELAPAAVQIARPVAAACQRQPGSGPNGFQRGEVGVAVGAEGLAARRDGGGQAHLGSPLTVSENDTTFDTTSMRACGLVRVVRRFSG